MCAYALLNPDMLPQQSVTDDRQHVQVTKFIWKHYAACLAIGMGVNPHKSKDQVCTAVMTCGRGCVHLRTTHVDALLR
jgi:hypothetical protein